MAQPKNINNAILNVLESIDAKLDASEKSAQKLNTNLEGMAKTGVVSEKEYESFAKFFGEMAKGLTTMVKAMDKVSAKTGERFGKFIGKIGETIAQFFEKTDEKQVTSFALLLQALGKYTLSFAIQMVIAIPFLLLAPIGAALFGLTIRVLLWAMGSAGKADKESTKGLEAILGLGKGILLFALAMILYVLVAPIVIIGAILFGLTIRLLLWVMGASGKNAKETAKGIGSILDLAKGILLFALAMIVVVLLFPVLLLGALIFALTLVIINLGLRLISSKKARRGVMSLVILGLAILIFALVISFFDKMVTWEALLKVAVTLAGLGLIMWIVGKQAVNIEKGSIAMIIAAVPILLIAISMMMWKSANPDWEDIAKLAATVVVVGLIGLLAGLGPIPGFIMAGAAAMIVAGAAILLIAAAMFVWMSSKVGWEDVGILGATVAMIGVEMALLGFASPFIFAGAAAMAFAAIPLILITGSLAVFKTIGWKSEDGSALEGALDSVVAGFLGGRMPGGIFAMIKFAAKAAARAVLMFITVPPFILAGLALIPIAKSLKMFKEAKWTPADSVNMEGVMAAIISAFSLPGDYARQKELGIYTNPFMLMMGIWALKDAGSTMASLAEGIQAFANLTVPIYGWVDAEDGSGGSLQIVEKRQMSNSDFDKAAYGMATVIGAIAEPLAAVGKLEKGASSGNPILDAIFAGNFVSKGVSALRNAGDTIVGLAEGVQSFANLTIPVYGLVTSTDEQGNENTKLEVIERKTMTTTDIQLASDNISLVIGVVAEALAEVGRTEANSSGWFSGGFVSKGAQALAGVGDNIKAIADTVKGYADLTIFPMELINAGTKDAKLVPGKPIKLTNADLEAAANSLKLVLGIVVEAVAAVGKADKESSGWFSDGYVTAGKEALGNVGLNIGAIADAVLGFATASFTPMGPDKDGNIVAIGPSVRLGKTELKAAATALGEVISLMGWEVYWFGKDFSGKIWALEYAVEANTIVTDVVSKVQGAIKKMEKITMEVATDYVAKMNTIFTGVYNIFSPENAPNASSSAMYFNMFTQNMKVIAQNADGLVRAGKGFEQMAFASTKWVASINKINGKKANQARWLVDSMSKPNAWKGAKSISTSTVRLKEQINGIDIERLKILNSLMCALATLGSTDVGLDKLGESIGEGMKEGFELLAEYLAELLEQGAGGGESPAGLPGQDPTAAAKPGAKPAAAGVAPAAAAPAGGDMAKKITQALQNTVLTVRVQGGGI